MQIRQKAALAFDDVLLAPKFNTVDSRSGVDTSVALGNLRLDVPIIAANMPTVCGAEMAAAMYRLGGLGIVHRMQSIAEQSNEVHQAYNVCEDATGFINLGAAVGVGEDALERAENCLFAGASCICIDVAHGHDLRVHQLINDLFDRFEDLTLIAGNIATTEAARYLLGACRNEDERQRLVLKVGVGGGSVCTTRIQTGCGVPTLQSVFDTVGLAPHIIADGGIKTSGDVVKSLAAGADAVMLGSLLAGTEETPGDTRLTENGLTKPYRGSASATAKKSFFGKAEYIEGEETVVPYKGSVELVVAKIMEGVRSGLTYCGAGSIEELYANAEFVKITAAGLAESKPHLLGR